MKNKDKKNFEILLTDWNVVEEVGLPTEDFGWYVFIADFKGCGDYHWGLGSFNAKKNCFYCKLSMGGMVTGAESVVAWKAYCNIFDDSGDKIIDNGCINDVRLIV